MAELVEAAAKAETVPDDNSKSALLGANYRHHGVALQLEGNAQVRWYFHAHLARVRHSFSSLVFETVATWDCDALTAARNTPPTCMLTVLLSSRKGTSESRSSEAASLRALERGGT